MNILYFSIETMELSRASRNRPTVLYVQEKLGLKSKSSSFHKLLFWVQEAHTTNLRENDRTARLDRSQCYSRRLV